MPIADRTGRKLAPRTADDAMRATKRHIAAKRQTSEDLLISRFSKLPVSHVPDYVWVEYEEVAKREYGLDDGALAFKMLRIGEFDYDYFCEKFLGVIPLWWQSQMWQEGLQKHLYNTGLLSNSGGKTTDISQKIARVCTYHDWAPENWGNNYLALHIGPLEDHALGAFVKIQEWIVNKSREQAYQLPEGGYAFRPMLLKPFITRAKQDKNKHEGFEWRDRDGAPMGIAVALPAAHGSTAADGRAPHWISGDEIRYWNGLIADCDNVLLPRFIRAPGGRLYLPGTVKGASVEMVTLNERGKDHEAWPDWHSVQLDLRQANKHIGEEEIAIAERNISKRVLRQVLGGQAVQPTDAKFSMEAARASMYGTTTPDWISCLGVPGTCRCSSCDSKSEDLAEVGRKYPFKNVRERVEARCDKCQRKKKDPTERDVADHDHPMIGAADVASSAAYDSIVVTVWDLEPPGFPEVWADVVYIEEIEPGTRVQFVAMHLSAVSRVIGNEVGFDRKSGVGHALKDLLLDMDGDFVELATNTRESKDEWLDFFSNLMDLGKWRSPLHMPTLMQIINYKRDDAKIQTDFLFAQLIAAQTAMPYLPSMVDSDAMEDTDAEEVGYMGLGGALGPEAFSLAADEDPMLRPVPPGGERAWR